MLVHKKYIDIQAFQMKFADGFNTDDIISITEKIDGCFEKNTLIALSDGSQKTIGEIVENKLDIEVLSYNEKKHVIEPKKVINWFNYGNKKEFIRIGFQSLSRHGGTPSIIYVTPDHLFFTKEGYKEAKNLTNKDFLGFSAEQLNFVQEQLCYGTLLGDSSVNGIVRNRIVTESYNRSIQYGHSNKQLEYLNFKNNLMKEFIYKTEPYITQYGSNATKTMLRFIRCFENIAKDVLNDNTQKKEVSFEWLNKLSPIGLAFWYMDDGSLSKGTGKQRERVKLHTEGFSEKENDIICSFFKDKFNLDCNKFFYKDKYYRIEFNSDESEKFFSLVAPYIIPSMQYKLPESFRMKSTFWDIWENKKEFNGLYWTKCFGVLENTTQRPCKDNYDIEVEDNHNYFAHGILVHNSNSSFQYFPEDNTVHSFSRKKILDAQNNLNGFYEYCLRLPNSTVDFLKNNPTLRVFGEWNLRHIVKYQPEQIKTFHCFDIYNTETKCWLPWLTVKTMCKEAKIDIVPEFYYGNFISWEHILSFVGKTEFGLDTGEGVVVKNQTRLNDPNNRLPFVTKLVAADFKERMERPAKEPISPEELEKRNKNRALAETIVTYPRVEKNLYKLITEDNLVPEGWEATDMPVIARNLPSAVYRDCVKEANDVVVEIENFGKICNQITMEYVKKMLKEKQLQF